MKMARINCDGFFVEPESKGFGPCMVLTGPWHSEFQRDIEALNITVLRLSFSAGWRGIDISFVAQLPKLRGIEIYNWDVKDISTIEKLAHLELIHLECDFHTVVDFTKFPHLTACGLRWVPAAHNVLNCRYLRYLNIIDYPKADLTHIRATCTLRELFLSSTKLVTLAGIERFQNLELLDLHRCPKLSTLDGIQNASGLRQVRLRVCKKVGDVSVFAGNKNITELLLDNCGEIDSLSPIRSTVSLEKLSLCGTTSVRDGDLTPIIELPRLNSVALADRRHYRPSRAEVYAAINNV